MSLPGFTRAFYPLAIAAILSALSNAAPARSATIEGTATDSGSAIPTDGATVSGELQPDSIQKLIFLFNAAGQLLEIESGSTVTGRVVDQAVDRLFSDRFGEVR